MKLNSEIIEDILFKGRGGTRWLSETAVQGEVWKALAMGQSPIDILLTPFENRISAPALAKNLLDRVRAEDRGGVPGALNLMPVEGIVAINVDLNTFIRFILPATGLDLSVLVPQLLLYMQHDHRRSGHLETVTFRQIAELVVEQSAGLSPDSALGSGQLSPELRTALLAVLLMADPVTRLDENNRPEVIDVLERGDFYAAEIGKGAAASKVDLSWASLVRPAPREIWQVSMNRPVTMTSVSVATVKADAARRLFEMSCRDITWAVIDSGIDGSHPAFRDHEKGGFEIRIDAAYDFSSMRRYASFDVRDDDPKIIEEIVAKAGLSEKDATDFLAHLREDAKRGRPYDWAVLSKILRREPDRLDPPKGSDRPVAHGTHVAGVLAGDWRENGSEIYTGVCPDLRLYDLRVLSGTNDDTEIAIIAALEFVRWLNARNRYLTIHGVNMSLGLEHDVKNFACGQTPVCRAADATVRSGVVVVAAAGNSGRHTFATADGTYEGYSSTSILDPGNTDSVITVGSTHRERPHEYGVSFFSSRGPTGDGRAKPDLVAPGERIDGPLPNVGLGRLDGTSMSAPHVSGVAALLLARNAEFIGNPMRVKRTLVASATDLGRERHFQGAGLVDALRALQSV